jgi:hypothetical protein
MSRLKAAGNTTNLSRCAYSGEPDELLEELELLDELDDGTVR